jgi:hypothetical protein
VLFRSEKAPQRFAEKDIYFAHERLPDSVLPDSDLLKSAHAYTSRFYEAAGRRAGPLAFVGSRLVDERSLDETALLAVGILLEEAARASLGKRGDLVFVEAAPQHDDDGDYDNDDNDTLARRDTMSNPEHSRTDTKRRRVEDPDIAEEGS